MSFLQHEESMHPVPVFYLATINLRKHSTFRFQHRVTTGTYDCRSPPRAGSTWPSRGANNGDYGSIVMGFYLPKQQNQLGALSFLATNGLNFG